MTSYKPISGYEGKVGKRPVLLSQEEIDGFLESLPLEGRGADRYSADLVTTQIKQKIGSILARTPICKSKLTDLAAKIMQRHNMAVVAPGTPVGITAAEAVGAAATQATLNTFKSSGDQNSATSTINELSDIILCKKNLALNTMNIFFLNSRMTAFEVASLASMIEGVNLRKLGVIPSILTMEEVDEMVDRYPWSADGSYAFHYQGRRDGKRPLISKTIIRLKFDVAKLYYHKITLTELAAYMEKEGDCYAYHGPTWDGIMDLFPTKSVGKQLKKEEMIDREMAAALHFIEQKSVQTIKGVDGVSDLQPAIVSLLSPIREVKLGDGKFEVSIDPKETAKRGINIRNIMAMIKEARKVGFNAVISMKKLSNSRLQLELGPSHSGFRAAISDFIMDHKKTIRKDFETKVTARLAEKKKAREDGDDARVAEIDAEPFPLATSEFLESTQFVYAVANGSNISGVLSLPGVDKKRTYCRNIHSINRALGIEAARFAFAYSLKETNDKTGSYNHGTNISILASICTSTGEPHGATFNGLARNKAGFLTQSSMERASAVLMEKGTMGTSESTRNSIPATMIGREISQGTGYFSVIQPIKGGIKVDEFAKQASNPADIPPEYIPEEKGGSEPSAVDVNPVTGYLPSESIKSEVSIPTTTGIIFELPAVVKQELTNAEVSQLLELYRLPSAAEIKSKKFRPLKESDEDDD